MSTQETWFQLPENECVRLTRMEMTAMNWLYAALSSCLHGQEDLAKRLEIVPDGPQRYAKMVDDLSSIVNDLTGTMPDKQKTKVRNMMHDMELRLVPKMTRRDVAVVLAKEDAMTLLDLAKENKCVMCMLDSEECRKCDLYKIMEAETPLEEYKGYLCPYNLAEWEK